ncbi:MAG: shikimate kinase [Desulfotignum sp.]|nr:shikimate kinase [Desulfotignum sp.]MCF8124914.1 shikimate kinase [Desulfotignum sp.]
MPCNPILIGYRCCGKSSVGKYLADILSCDFVDTDKYIELQCAASIEKLVAEKGWTYFRQIETKILEQIIHKENQVIATGGGMVLAPKNRSLINAFGFVVWLTADVNTIVRRMTADLQTRASRPRFTTRSLFDETCGTLAQRTPLYEKLADMTVDTTCHQPLDIAWMVKRRLDHVRI